MNNTAPYDVVKTMLATEGEPYSPEAKTKIEDFSADYGVELVLEAARVAERDGVQQISCIHVEAAKNRLRSIERRNWKKKLYGPVGGGFLGIGLPILISFFSNASQVSPTSAITCALSLLVGTALLMLDALT